MEIPQDPLKFGVRVSFQDNQTLNGYSGKVIASAWPYILIETDDGCQVQIYCTSIGLRGQVVKRRCYSCLPDYPTSPCCGKKMSPRYSGTEITRYRCPCGKTHKA